MSNKKTINTTVFKSHRSYWDFYKKVKWEERYIYNNEVQEFLDTVLETCDQRRKKLSKQKSLWRAQIGFDEDSKNHDVPIPFNFERMKPLENRAKEGRANPKGISYLYLASQKITAVSEVRPWLGSFVSVAEFKLKRDAQIIDCSNDLIDNPYILIGEQDNETKEKYVWSDINEAYSTPVDQSDDIAEYVPTQILSELFRNNGFEGIAYKSSCGKGHNIVLFNTNLADTDKCELHGVNNIDISHAEIQNPIYRKNESAE